MMTSLEEACRERVALLEQPPAVAAAVALLRNAARIILLAPAVDEKDLISRAADVGAVAAAAVALRMRGVAAGDDGFTVRMDWGGALPQNRAWLLPAGEAAFLPSDWLQGFAVAVLAHDAASLGILVAHPTRVALEQLAVSAGPSWALRLVPMLVAAARRDAQAAREAGGAAAPPAVADAGAGPRALWQVARRLAEGRPASSLSEAVAALNPALQNESTELVARALITLALEAGATLPASVRPVSLSLPARRWRAPALHVHHTLRAVQQGDEARWFLDLAGYPRASRRHHIARRTLGEPPVEHLVACYEMQATSGMPLATAEFVLLDPAAPTDEAPAPLALDAGQLLWLAEILASGDPDPATLEEALGCARAALQRLGTGDERLTQEQFGSAQGRQLWKAEPGRFTRVRLTAYVEALASALVARRATAPAPRPREDLAPADEVNAFRSALLGAEAVKQAVAPLLEALRQRDADGLVAQLQPHAQDYDKVFSAKARKTARDAYENLWSHSSGLFSVPEAEQTELQVFVAPAGLLDSEVEMVRPFPQGYRAIAPLLDPHRTWVCWKYTRPGEGSGLAYDGLVWCDDHWAWFPKPYRVLAEDRPDA